MPGLRLCSGAEAVKKLQKAGWEIARRKGSHVMMVKQGYEFTLSVPQHPELGPGILRNLIKTAGLTIEEFNRL